MFMFFDEDDGADVVFIASAVRQEFSSYLGLESGKPNGAFTLVRPSFQVENKVHGTVAKHTNAVKEDDRAFVVRTENRCSGATVVRSDDSSEGSVVYWVSPCRFRETIPSPRV